MPRILYIDPHQSLRKKMVSFLQSREYAVTEADNGKEGMKKILSMVPDIVISALAMPEMDGLQMRAELRAHHPERANIPFIFTASRDAEQSLPWKTLEVEEVMYTPIDPYALDALIRKKIERHQKLQRQFVNNVSSYQHVITQMLLHELRIPLNAIIGFSDIMKGEKPGTAWNEKHTMYINHISRSGHAMLALLNNAADGGDLISQKAQLIEQEIDLERLLTECIYTVKYNTSPYALDIHSHITPDMPLLRGDHTLLCRGISALLQEMGDSGKPTHVAISVLTNAQGNVELSIKTDAKGWSGYLQEIPAITLDHAVDPPGCKTETRGVHYQFLRAVLEIHGGSAQMKADAGGSTTLLLTFPKERTITDDWQAQTRYAT